MMTKDMIQKIIREMLMDKKEFQENLTCGAMNELIRNRVEDFGSEAITTAIHAEWRGVRSEIDTHFHQLINGVIEREIQECKITELLESVVKKELDKTLKDDLIAEIVAKINKAQLGEKKC